jgi:hypothetical protein
MHASGKDEEYDLVGFGSDGVWPALPVTRRFGPCGCSGSTNVVEYRAVEAVPLCLTMKGAASIDQRKQPRAGLNDLQVLSIMCRGRENDRLEGVPR